MSNATPPPCDQDVFQNGKSLLAADTSDCGAVGFEPWVVEIRNKSEQRVDWHFSGGVAHVLYIGDRAKIQEAIDSTPCPGRIMQYYDDGGGLFRNGADQAPEGAIATFYDGSRVPRFVVKEEG